MRMQQVEATSGTSRAARGSTGTLAAHVPGEERRDMTRHPNRGRNGLHTVCGGGQTAQDVVYVGDMDNERDLSAAGGQQVAHMHPFRGGYMLGQLRQESRGVAAESTKLCDNKRNEADVGATPHQFGLLNTT
jgi:hypothetical protein